MTGRVRDEVIATLKLGAPLIAAQLAQISITFVDTIMAGRLSPRDLAAVAVGGSAWFPVWALTVGLLLSVTPSVAHLYGAGRHADIGYCVRQGLWLSLIASAVGVAMIRNRSLAGSSLVLAAVLLAGVSASGLVHPVAAQPGGKLAVDLDTLLRDPVLKGAGVGLVVRHADTGELLYGSQGDLRRQPASNMKLVTSAAATDVLGVDYRFTTSVLAQAKPRGQPKFPVPKQGKAMDLSLREAAILITDR